MELKLTIRCPSCGEQLNISIQDNKVVSVTIEGEDATLFVSNEEIKDVLKEHNIEFG